MNTLAAAHPGTKPGLVGHDAALRQNRLGVQANHEDQFVESYAAHYGKGFTGIERWAELEAGRVVHTFDLIPRDEILRTKHYNDWLRPQGDLLHAALTVLSRDPGRFFLFTYQVEMRAAATALDAVFAILRDVAPLMRPALDVNRIMLGLKLDASLLRHGVKPEDAALLLLAESGAILYANARAEQMLAAGRAIWPDLLGRLSWSDPDAAARVEAAARRTAPSVGLTFRTGRSGEPIEVRLLPVSEQTIADPGVPLILSAVPPRLLVILQPDLTRPHDTGRLLKEFRLTRSEAEVVLALADGATLAEIAEARTVYRETVRAQLKAAMAKTGSRRQSDLVRVALRLRQDR